MADIERAWQQSAVCVALRRGHHPHFTNRQIAAMMSRVSDDVIHEEIADLQAKIDFLRGWLKEGSRNG